MAPETCDSLPDTEAVLDVLADRDCRRILEQLDEPRTAAELARRCDIPQSTVYRKLTRMAEVDLLDESTVVDIHGRNASEYSLAVPGIDISLAGDGSLSVSIPERVPRDRPVTD